eukprot:403368178
MLKSKTKQQNPNSAKYYNRIIQSYSQNNDNFSKKNQDLLGPEQINLDSDEFREEQKKIILSKKDSAMNNDGLPSIDNKSSTDDVFSNYLRELTMAPMQFKKHQNIRANQQIFEQIKTHIQKTANISDPDVLIQHVNNSIQNSGNQQSEFTLLRKATLKRNLESSPSQSSSNLQQLLNQSNGSGNFSQSGSNGPSGSQTIDYQKLAQQVRRLSQLHQIKVNNYNSKQQSQQKLRQSMTKGAILEEDENDHKDTDRKLQYVQSQPNISIVPLQSQKTLALLKPQKITPTYQFITLEPKSRKLQLKKELKEKSLLKIKEYHELKKQMSNHDVLESAEREKSLENQNQDLHNQSKESPSGSFKSSRKNSARLQIEKTNQNIGFLRKSATIKIQDDMQNQSKDLLPKGQEVQQPKLSGLKVGDSEQPDYSFIFRLTQQKALEDTQIKLPKSIENTNQNKGKLQPIVKPLDLVKTKSQYQTFRLNVQPVYKRQDPQQPEDSKKFGEYLKKNLKNTMNKSQQAFFSGRGSSNKKQMHNLSDNEENQLSSDSRLNSSFTSQPDSLKSLSLRANSKQRKQYMEKVNQKKLQLFDDLLDTVDARLRESIMSQQQLFTSTPFSVSQSGSAGGLPTTAYSNFFNKRLMSTHNGGDGLTSVKGNQSQQVFFPNSDINLVRSQSQQKLQHKDSQNSKGGKYRLKTFKVEMTRNQFNIANLPYVKYGPEILQDRNYQFKIIKDEMSILYDKCIEFRTKLTYKYSFQSTVVFQTMGRETQRRFNAQFEELIGFIIEIIQIVLLKFGDDPDRIGLKDYSKIVQQTVKVKIETNAFRDNQTLFIDLTDMYKKSYDAYYIMTKMLGFSQLHYDANQKLQQYICRARLSCKELMEDFRNQEELLNREFTKEKMYIESMLMRGDDLYNYRYRQKLDTATLNALNKDGKENYSYQYIHQFLDQQSTAYAKKLKKIQQDYQNQQQINEKKKQEELQREKIQKELADNPNLFLIDPKFMEAMSKDEIKQQMKKEKKKKKGKSQAQMPQKLNQFGMPIIPEEQQQQPHLKGKMKYKVEAKVQTQPQFTGKQALDLKLQIKEVMKNMRNMANQKQQPKNKERHERRDSYEDMDQNAFKPAAHREPENYISNETREFIQNSINKNKLKSAGFLHPAQLEKMIYLENEDDEQAMTHMKYYSNKKNKNANEEIILIHTKSELKALKEVEKAVRVGIQSCKEVNKLQSMSQSLRDIVQMSNPVIFKKPKKRHPEARKDADD